MDTYGDKKAGALVAGSTASQKSDKKNDDTENNYGDGETLDMFWCDNKIALSRPFMELGQKKKQVTSKAGQKETSDLRHTTVRKQLVKSLY